MCCFDQLARTLNRRKSILFASITSKIPPIFASLMTTYELLSIGVASQLHLEPHADVLLLDARTYRQAKINNRSINYPYLSALKISETGNTRSYLYGTCIHVYFFLRKGTYMLASCMHELLDKQTLCVVTLINCIHALNHTVYTRPAPTSCLFISGVHLYMHAESITSWNLGSASPACFTAGNDDLIHRSAVSIHYRAPSHFPNLGQRNSGWPVFVVSADTSSLRLTACLNVEQSMPSENT